MKRVVRILSLGLLVLVTSCSKPGGESTVATLPASDPVPPAPLAQPAVGGPRVVFLGDSLAAGLGVDADEAFPARVQASLGSAGCPFQLVNAGVSGDTSAGGRSRIEWVLRQAPAVVVVELGANDALRGQPLEGIEDNLRAILRAAKAGGARVLLAGIRIPPSYGPEYSGGFASIYPRLAREESVTLLPFLLDGVGGDPSLNQLDGIHPNAEGHRRVAALVVPYLRPLLGCVGT